MVSIFDLVAREIIRSSLVLDRRHPQNSALYAIVKRLASFKIPLLGDALAFSAPTLDNDGL